MNCNIPKPPKMPKSWYRLPQYERDQLTKILTDTAYDIADKESAETQEIWIKLCCILLHDRHEFDELELLQFIAGWKMMYRRNERCEDKEAQTAWLEKEMQRCFPSGFPQMRIDDMKGNR